MNFIEYATQNFLLTAMGADLERLMPHLKIVTLDQYLLLAEQEMPVEHVYFPLDGMISLVTAMDTGEVIELGTFGNDGGIGAPEALNAQSAFARAVVQVPGRALSIPAPAFRKVATESNRIREIVSCYEHVLLAQLSQTAACNALHSLDRRLARWLLQTNDRVGTKSILLTQDFVAQMLGVSRTTVTLLAGKLQQSGIIRYSRGHIEILDVDRLRAASCECYETIRRRTGEAYDAAHIPLPARLVG